MWEARKEKKAGQCSTEQFLTTHIQKSEEFYSPRNFGSLLIFFEKYVFCEIH
jgi:hypothetical protein